MVREPKLEETIENLKIDQSVSWDYCDLRYVVKRVTENKYSIGKYALMMCLDIQYCGSLKEVFSILDTY
ncbi:hypothetical protein DFQ01_11077 [Paenibacillus cellulosilyticus]|uniref:Uncharacterized protein n=1 Tax=Paenibacillus cellulosilyticus TaxID=375489 RepID=A0A2V2YSL3_9BACL|nr:hypothetical protein DFQ01_11077 [Paenibacillus cellulosilyticus]